jgi:hypothetical protein
MRPFREAFLPKLSCRSFPAEAFLQSDVSTSRAMTGGKSGTVELKVVGLRGERAWTRGFSLALRQILPPVAPRRAFDALDPAMQGSTLPGDPLRQAWFEAVYALVDAIRPACLGPILRRIR